MKAVVILDDLDLAEGTSQIASHSVRLGWDGEWYDLDLSDEHAQDLWNGIEPYLKAARRQHHKAAAVEQDRKPLAVEADPDIPRYGRVVLYHAVGLTPREYWRRFRKWASANGYEVRQMRDRTYYHPVDAVEMYERHLSAIDRQEAKAG